MRHKEYVIEYKCIICDCTIVRQTGLKNPVCHNFLMLPLYYKEKADA